MNKSEYQMMGFQFTIGVLKALTSIVVPLVFGIAFMMWLSGNSYTWDEHWQWIYAVFTSCLLFAVFVFAVKWLKKYY